MTERIVLVGNSTNTNRGCEAIARGTQFVLESVANEPVEVRSGVLVHTDRAEAGVKAHTPRGEPAQFPLRPDLESSISSRILDKLKLRRRLFQFKGLEQELVAADKVFEVGGDNYSLDYGRPYTFLDLDTSIRKFGRPLFIWGASIGPFNDDVDFERYMLSHLKNLDHVFVRESVSYAYLTDNGLCNVTLMADPAICMKPEEPDDPGFDVDAFSGAIGINLSPFQARQLTGSGNAFWATTMDELASLADFGAELLRKILALDSRPILLIPHVMAPERWNNDRMLLEDIMVRLTGSEAERVALLPDWYTAPELKWAIGRCSVFAGSRTHSTLAAISSGVPTLAFAYSRKATGIMRDLYGDDAMLVRGKLLNLDISIERIRSLLSEEKLLRQTIAKTLPDWRNSVISAGRKALALHS